MIPELFKQCACASSKWAKCDHPFHFRKQVAGRRWTISLDGWLGHEKIRSVGAAEDVAAEMIAAMKAGTFSPVGPSGPGAVIGAGPAQGHTFASVAAIYQGLIETDPERKPDYQANVRSMIAVITGWRIPQRPETLGDLPIGGVDNAVLERFYKAQVAAGKSASYRNKMIQFLRAFSRWTVREGYRATPWLSPHDAGVTVKRRKVAQRNRRLALAAADDAGRVIVASEFDRVIAGAEPRLADLCVATMETGARLSELTGLLWRAVDLPRGQITIRDSKDPDGVKARILPISPTLRPVLARRRFDPDGERQAPDAYVFGNAFGEPVASIATAWENAVLWAHGIAAGRDPQTHGLTPEARAAYRAINLVFHDLRHEAASQWLESGAFDLPTISYLLGHTSLETTQIYLNVRPEGLAAKMAAFHAAREAAAGKSGVPVAYATQSAPPTGLKLVVKKNRNVKER